MPAVPVDGGGGTPNGPYVGDGGVVQEPLGTTFWVTVGVVVWALFSVAAQTAWRDRLDRLGVAVGCVSVAWKGSALNRALMRASLVCPAALRVWFGVGAAVGCTALVAAPLLLAYILWGALIRRYGQPAMSVAGQSPTDTSENSYQPSGGVELVPIIPGLTVPLAHAAYIFAALLVNGVFHEAGHALAALGEGVRVISCGAFITAMYPGAFVELDSHQLSHRHPSAQIRIYCAGVFHNFVIFAVAAAVLRALPTLVSPWYDYRGGRAAVMSVHPASALAGVMRPRDVITSVDGACSVSSSAAWHQCINRVVADFDLGITGFCVHPLEFSPGLDHSTSPKCCDVIDVAEGGETRGNGAGNTSARDRDKSGARLCYSADGFLGMYACLPARRVFKMSESRCLSGSECRGGDVCIHHTEESNASRLLQIGIDGSEPVLFLGHPLELIRDIQVTDYVRKCAKDRMGGGGRGVGAVVVDSGGGGGGGDGRSRLGGGARTTCGNTLWLWPPEIERALGYVLSLSVALGVLNIVPAFGFDGQHAVAALYDLLGLTPAHKDTVVVAVCTMGTALLLTNVLVVVVGIFS